MRIGNRITTSRVAEIIRSILPIAGILALAAVLRFAHVTQPLIDAFSWREASTAMMADNFHLRSWNVFYPEVSWTGPGPSYQGREFQIVSWITAFLYRLFGWHDWFGRAVAASFGLVSILSLHQLVARLSDRPHAHAAALALAIMPGAIIIDSSFLPDAAMLALTTVGLWLFVAWLQNGKRWLIPLFIIFTTLGILAKPPGVTVLVPQAYAAWWILRSRGSLDRKHVVGLLAALVSVVLPVGLYYGWAIWLGTHYPPYHVAGSGNLWENAAAMVRQGFYLIAAAKHLEQWFLTLPLLLLVCIGLLASLTSGRPPVAKAAPWLFHLWLGANGLLFLLAAEEIKSNPWNLLYFAGPFAAFAATGLLLLGRSQSPSLHSWSSFARMGIATLIVLWSGTLGVTIIKAPYAATGRELGIRLNELSSPDHLVIAVSEDVGDPIAIYYSRRRGWVFPAGGGERRWDLLLEGDEAVAVLEQLRMSGADWFGVVRNAHDSYGRQLLVFNKNVVDHLNRTAQQVVNDEQMLIWRLH